MGQLIRKWAMSFKQSVRESTIDNRLARLPLQNPNEQVTGAENAMRIDLVPELPPSGGYENLVTAIDVSSRNFFIYPTTSQDGKTFEQTNVMNKHA